MHKTAATFGVILVAMMVAAATATAVAQEMVPIAARNDSGSRAAGRIVDSGHLDHDPNHLSRIVPAALVGLGSGFALGLAAYGVAGCSGSDCFGAFLGVAVPAAIFGGIVGSAAGAAMPRGRGECTGLQRFGMGVGGAFLGALAGLPLAMVSGPFGIMATIPMGSVMFMGRC